jgi:hypothetical protein
MPQLAQYKWILDVVFFLYPTKEDALNGTEYGGTGFLIAVPSRRWPAEFYHVHGVTNWHVACDGSPVIRINRRDGRPPDIFDFDVSEWIFRPHHHDIAISPPLMLDPDIHQAEAIGLGSLLTKEEEIKDDINAAEDVFMVGRFVDYEGTETNVPACRFGNISMMNAEVEQPTKYRGRSIVVDMHSRTGFSGSPVFVYRTSGSGFSPVLDLMLSWHYIKMIGIHWGQFREEYAFEEATRLPIWRRIWKRWFPPKAASAEAKSLITKGMYVRGFSGMSCVVPAQAILNLINSPELQAMRETEEIRLEPAMARRSLRPQATQEGPPKFGPPEKTPEEIASEWIEQSRGMGH